MSAGRYRAALLAADVAGYSRLTGADEEGTLARLKAARKAFVDPAIASPWRPWSPSCRDEAALMIRDRSSSSHGMSMSRATCRHILSRLDEAIDCGHGCTVLHVEPMSTARAARIRDATTLVTDPSH